MENNFKVKKRDIGIDLLRSLSILYIVGYWHMFNYTDPFPAYNNVITDLVTRVALAVLVLISGYYASATFQNAREFYIKKVLRVYPLYLVALFSYFLLGLCTLKMALLATLPIQMFFEPPPYNSLVCNNGSRFLFVNTFFSSIT